MRQTASLPSLDSLLQGCFGDRWAGIVRILGAMRADGLDFVIINLPVHCDAVNQPNDLDLILPPEHYHRARDFLRRQGFLRLDLRPGPRQSVHLIYLSGVGHIRLHLHEDLWFFGLRLMAFSRIRSHTIDLDGFLVADPTLDFFVLHWEWFFRRKAHYLDRIAQLAPQATDIFLSQRREELCDEHAALMQRLERLADSRVEVTRALQSQTMREARGARTSMARYVVQRTWSKTRRWLSGGRRGTLVFFMGIDGSGKTTAAHELVRLNHAGGFEARYCYLGLKETLLQKLRQAGASDQQLSRTRTEHQTGIVDHIARRSHITANLLNVALSLAYIVDYWFRMLPTRRLLTRNHNLIVADRTYYDKLGDHDRWGNKLFYRLLPRPDLVVALHGDLNEFQRRKQEFDLPVLVGLQKKMDRAWTWLESRGCRLIRIDTAQHDLARTCELIANEVWSVVSGAHADEEDITP